jgi:hypothetical protein
MVVVSLLAVVDLVFPMSAAAPWAKVDERLF